MTFLTSLLALAAIPQLPPPPQVTRLRRQPNIVLIVADDLGVDMLSCYAEGNNPPCTPNLDSLATEGLLFRNAWVNPLCSPTRAHGSAKRTSSHSSSQKRSRLPSM